LSANPIGAGKHAGFAGKMRRKNGASEGIRTLDIHLGKVTLYQTELRSLPKAGTK
jgi:hypothetical protein